MNFGMPTLLENSNIEENMSLCSELGLDFIELNMNFPEYQLDQMDLNRYLKLAEENQIYYTIHLEEELNVCGYNSKVTEAYVTTVLETIAIAKRLKVPVLNMHLAQGIYITLPDRKVYMFQEHKEQYLRMLLEFRQLCDQAVGDSGIRICIENAGGYREYAREGIELLLESPVFGLTFDLGHDHSVNGMDEPFIRSHKGKLQHMHIHDGIGTSNHLAIGTGEIDLQDKFKLAKECDCRCVLETKTIEGLKESVSRLKDYVTAEEWHF
jgi:sugar phosphate isomerase/epimerase